MPAAFRPLYERLAARVRARFALGRLIGGVAIGLAVGAAGSAVLWRTGHGPARPFGVLAGLVGAAVGLASARRHRWSDVEIALYLDARLDEYEVVTTALALEAEGREDGPVAVVAAEAVRALERATPAIVRVPFVRPWHVAIPLAAGLIAVISLAPLPPTPLAPSAPPGSEPVRLAGVLGLEKVTKLAELAPRDEAQRRRLKKLAEDAERIRTKLRDGVQRREAEAEIGKLEDGIAAERLSLGDGEQRQGMESALGKLGDDPNLARAQRALGDRDLVRFDDEMERLADTLERADRERAQRTLADAAEAARRASAPGVAKAIEAERDRLARRGLGNDQLRALAKELAEGPSGAAERALERLAAQGDRRALAGRLERSLATLTPAQQKRLVEHLKEKLRALRDATPTDPSNPELTRDADGAAPAEELDEKRLADELRKLADTPPDGTPQDGSEEAERQRALDAAREGAGDAKRDVSGVPLPIAGGESGKGVADPSGSAPSGAGPGGSAAAHAGETAVVSGDALRARATGRMNPGRPMPGVVMGRTAARPGDTANARGLGALGAAAPREIGGVERGDVPEEYRAQVGRYFEAR